MALATRTEGGDISAAEHLNAVTILQSQLNAQNQKLDAQNQKLQRFKDVLTPAVQALADALQQL